MHKGLIPLIALATISLTACAADHSHPPATIKNAICMVGSTAGNKVSGWVKFEQDGEKVKITAEIQGLSASAKHAIHIHQFGDASDTQKGKRVPQIAKDGRLGLVRRTVSCRPGKILGWSCAGPVE